jgi:hypothetical protein
MSKLTKVQQPVKIQNWGGAFQVEVISDPSVKHSLFGWMSALNFGYQSNWRFSNLLDSKKLSVLKHSHMYVSKRPGNTRTGYLCFYSPLKVAIFVEDVEKNKNLPEDKQRVPRIAILRMRHSPSVYNNNGSIFAASLVVSDSTLLLEDILIWQGLNIWETECFSKRWQLLKEWIENDWCEDETLQRGLIIKPRKPANLSLFKSNIGDIWEFIPEDAGKRRLIWRDKRHEKMVLSNYPQKAPVIKQIHTKPIIVPEVITEPVIQKGILDTYFPSLPCATDGSLIAIAKKVPEAGPDVYTLYDADTGSLGSALIRKMTISLAMRTHCKDTINVKVEWNTSFDKWEIVDVDVRLQISPASAFIKK